MDSNRAIVGQQPPNRHRIAVSTILRLQSYGPPEAPLDKMARKKKRETVFFRGRPRPVVDELVINHRPYFVLEQWGRDGRRRCRAVDPRAGPRGDLRMILVLPRGRASRRHLAALNALSQGIDELPRIVECDFQRDNVYVVTHWIEGPTLESYLDRARRGKTAWPSPYLAFSRYKGLAHALGQMYENQGIIHGDIKPENLVITARSSRLVMIDFGSAWTVEQTADLPADHERTNAYAAPERLLGEPLAGFHSDQFSATVVLYKLLTDEIPYAKMGGLAGLPNNRSDFEGEFVPPSRKARERRYVPRRIWSAIDEVVFTGLALDAKDRFQTTRDWRNAVDRVHRMLDPPLDNDEKDGPISRILGWLAKRVERRAAARR